MNRKIALLITAAGLSVPVGAVVASSPAFAVTRPQSVIGAAASHKESVDTSRDTSKEGSRVDTSKDSSKDGSSNDPSTDTSKEGSRSDSSKDSSKDGSSNDPSTDTTSIDASPGSGR